MWKTFEAVDRHVTVTAAALPLRPEAANYQSSIPELEASIESVADLDAAVFEADPDVVVQNHRFEAAALGERPAFHDEYPVVHLRHGASVGRGEIDNTTRDLGDVVDLALAPGERWAARYREAFPESVDIAVVGIPEADDLVETDPPGERCVLYAPTNHNYGGGCYLETAEAVLDTFADTDYRLLFRPHPMDRIEEPGASVTERCRERIADLRNVVFDEADTPRESMLAADLLVSDYSGIVTEWLHTGRPLVQLTAVASGSDVPELGYVTDELTLDVIDRLYEDGYPPTIERRVDEQLAALGIPMDGHAGERAAREVVGCTQ
ncbi:CDP-glycerol glycerophosphotransferase family protein [Halobaculum rarum]|uniref:CDP-glycerol glycerophosphotransferase family protein n=1 Tax=Halobaculum rarum TaxID=3075122 RepID=UPI0032AFC83F